MKTKSRKKQYALKVLLSIFILIILINLVYDNKSSIENISIIKEMLQSGQKDYDGSDPEIKIGDTVYYNYKDTWNEEKNNWNDPEDIKKLEATIEPKGNAEKPGRGDRRPTNTFTSNADTSWKVWDKNGKELILVSNKSMPTMNFSGYLGYLWWEYNAHKMASVFGHGYGAKEGANAGYEYTVGSRINSAPDMNGADKGKWHIGAEPIENKIESSAARALTLLDVEEKLNIKDPEEKRKINSNYGKEENIKSKFIPQRDVKSVEQSWSDKKIGKANNKNYTIKNETYELSFGNIPDSKYKEMLFNSENATLATTAMFLENKGEKYHRWEIVAGKTGKLWIPSRSAVFVDGARGRERNLSPKNNAIRVLVTLKDDVKYKKVSDNEWDIVVPTKIVEKEKEVEFNVTVVNGNESFKPIIKLKENVKEEPKEFKIQEENGKYSQIIKYKEKPNRSGQGDTATFWDKSTKYIVSIDNLPRGYRCTINGNGVENNILDLEKYKDPINITLENRNVKRFEEYVSGEALEIGDIVYYDHKEAANENDKQKQTVTLEPGDAKNPGYNQTHGFAGNQIFNVEKNNATWMVWDKRKTEDGKWEVTIVSSNVLNMNVRSRGKLGYIWWEHNAYKAASIYGYGYGAKKDATKDFKYKVGSDLFNAPDMTEGDKGIWTIGQEPLDTINVSGSRALTYQDIIDLEKRANTDKKEDENVSDGEIVDVVEEAVIQRNIESENQEWIDKERGIAKNKNYKYKRIMYGRKANLPAESKYERLLNGLNISLATRNMDPSGQSTMMGAVKLENFNINENYFMYLGYDSNSNDSNPIAVLTVLEDDLKFQKRIKLDESKDFNEWDIVPERKEESIKIKVKNTPSEIAKNAIISGIKILPSGDKAISTKNYSTFVKVDGEIEEYDLVLDKYNGKVSFGSDIGASYDKAISDYELAITNLPSGYDFKIVGKEGKVINIDDEEKEYTIEIYKNPKRLAFSVEYEGLVEDPSFYIYGTVKLLKDGRKIDSKMVALDGKLSKIEFLDEKVNENSTSEPAKYEITFERDDIRTSEENKRHTYKVENNILKVKYFPKIKKTKKIRINTNFKDNNEKGVGKIIVTLKQKINGKTIEEDIELLKEDNFNKELEKPIKTDDGKDIKYSLEMKSKIQGYTVKIEEQRGEEQDIFNIKLRPIVKLPFTGSIYILEILGIGLFAMLASKAMFKKKSRKTVKGRSRRSRRIVR